MATQYLTRVIPYLRTKEEFMIVETALEAMQEVMKRLT